MKYNPKVHVDIEELTDKFIDRLNKFAIDQNLDKIYSLDIKVNKLKGNVSIGDKKENNNSIRTLVFSVSNLENREKLNLFSVDYQLKNPAEALKGTYKKALYIEFYFSVLQGFSLNFENIIRQQRAEDLITNNMKLEAEREKNIIKNVLHG